MVGHTLGILMVLAWLMELCQEPDEAVCNCIDLLEFVGGSQHATLLWPGVVGQLKTPHQGPR